MFTIRRLFRSFSCALRGLRVTLREEQSFRIQLAIAFVVLGLILYFPLSITHASILILLIIIVLVLELVNSVFERMIDVLRPRLHRYVQDIKDIMAATVLVASVGALIVGIIIFYPYFFTR